MKRDDDQGSVEYIEEHSVPGPGTYNLEKSLIRNNGIMIGKSVKKSIFDERYASLSRELPGPGSYTIPSQFLPVKFHARSKGSIEESKIR